MKLKFRQLTFFLILILLSSCGNNECIQKSNYKQKKYRVKKIKAYQRGAGGGTSSSADVAAELEAKREQERLDRERAEAISKQEAEEEHLTIAETKIGAPPEPTVEKKVEFKGEEIEITEDGYQYSEEILFVNSTDLFSNPKEARNQLKDISKLLKNNKDLTVTIIGNTATSTPQNGVIYGSSNRALNQEVTLNTKDATIRESMIARAKRVFRLLVDSGVDENQLDVTTGTHGKTRKERVVTFKIKAK